MNIKQAIEFLEILNKGILEKSDVEIHVRMVMA